METFFPTSTPAPSTTPPASYGELVDFWNANHSRVPELENTINELDKQIAHMNITKVQLSSVISRLRTSINDFEMELKELFRNGDIDEETACSLAKFFDINLGDEREVCITVTYRGTAIIPLSMNPDDIDWGNHISFSFEEYGSEIEFDIYEDGVDVEVM